MHFLIKSVLLIGVMLAMHERAISKDILIEGDSRHMMESKKGIPAEKKQKVIKYVLDNGITVLVYPDHRIPRVSLHTFYDVGSKDEGPGEKGRAHLIEHLWFKGTDAPEGVPCLRLSESDINVALYRLSGSQNAFTSWDYTGYLQLVSSRNWKTLFPIIADCMQHCAFKEDHLNSEMNAVIQEMKRDQDNYMRTAEFELIGAIFSDHPYRDPMIGYKQDLWTASGKELRAFFKRHYTPNNAVLVVVGDVDPEEVLQEAKRWFGSIPAETNYVRPEFHFKQDIGSKQVTLYRDIQQPIVIAAFVIPGMSKKMDQYFDLLSIILGQGKSSRLRHTIVDELQLATSLSTFSWGMFEHGVFFITFKPKSVSDILRITQLITQELVDIATNGLDDKEVERAVKQMQMSYYNTVMEDIETLAYMIGQTFLATGDENYVFSYLVQPSAELKNKLVDLVKTYFRPAIMHQAMILPLPDTEREEWHKLQEASDEEDNRILSARERTSPVEPPRYAETIVPQPLGKFEFPKANKALLSNGVELLYKTSGNAPKIDLVLEFKAEPFYDPIGKEGLYAFMSKMLAEGTQNYTAAELAQTLETLGMNISAYPGGLTMSMLSVDLPKGLELLNEVLTKCTFPVEEIEKVRAQLLAQLKNFWDEPSVFIRQLAKEAVYKGQPYSRNILGTTETLGGITREDLVDFYKKVVTPCQTRIALVGDLSGYDVVALGEKELGSWTGSPVEQMKCGQLSPVACADINYPINRDQVALCYASLSVTRTDPDYDKLVLFDQILGGGVLGSMHSRLFELRESTGLFYSILGSVVADTSLYPGMVLVKTLVSLDRLQEAEKAIIQTLKTAADSITLQELEEVKRAISHHMIGNFESNHQTAETFLFLEKYNLPADYLDNRANQLARITVDEVKRAVKRVLDTDRLVTIRVGRMKTE